MFRIRWKLTRAGRKLIEDQYIGALAQFFGRPAAADEPLLRGDHARRDLHGGDVRDPRPKDRSTMPDQFANRRVRHAGQKLTPPGCVFPMAWAGLQIRAKASTTAITMPAPWRCR